MDGHELIDQDQSDGARSYTLCGASPPPPPKIFEGQSLPQQTIYHWKGNLSKSPIHFRYRQNHLISRLYEQFSRDDFAKAPQWLQKKTSNF